ncbi:maltose acetyltransferase domain-containing protein [Natronosalvus rutilus]|uniref:Maltose/galactoside acetyltransferase domain-containing protein n=1 Tax=Natronosalvus rutilus TaxID=2953753 RepID=A0A9E7SWT3_9EURY|nr:maltose acetyltransferase domain-containing protein [Natronosalvus rutilus]UTF55780.1 hypothetical protein NGM29_19035 [Natronosalvus rutilus]
MLIKSGAGLRRETSAYPFRFPTPGVDESVHNDPRDTSRPQLRRGEATTRRYNRTTVHDQTERRELLEALLGSCGEDCEIVPSEDRQNRST